MRLVQYSCVKRRREDMNNKRRLFSTLLCVAALTAGLFVSGCGSDKAGGIGSVVSSVVDGGSDEKAAAKLNTLIDATNRFNGDNATWGQNYADSLAKLKGVSDPEQKRKIIGNEFIEVFNEESSKIEGAKFLAQGTIYPDVIESQSIKGPSAVIKSHHNVGGLPEDMKFELLEPLRELFKDEVRKVGEELGIPSHLVHRHPFPGPGLGIRVLGEVDAEKVRILQEADDIFIEELYKHELYDKVSQAFVVLLPVKSVGVMGDERTYEYTAVVRSANTIDFMTATWSKLPYEFLELISNRIINEVKGINRVAYDISSKPPATIEWE